MAAHSEDISSRGQKYQTCLILSSLPHEANFSPQFPHTRDEETAEQTASLGSLLSSYLTVCGGLKYPQLPHPKSSIFRKVNTMFTSSWSNLSLRLQLFVTTICCGDRPILLVETFRSEDKDDTSTTRVRVFGTEHAHKVWRQTCAHNGKTSYSGYSSLRKHPFLLRSSPLGTFREEEHVSRGGTRSSSRNVPSGEERRRNGCFRRLGILGPYSYKQS